MCGVSVDELIHNKHIQIPLFLDFSQYSTAWVAVGCNSIFWAPAHLRCANEPCWTPPGAGTLVTEMSWATARRESFTHRRALTSHLKHFPSGRCLSVVAGAWETAQTQPSWEFSKKLTAHFTSNNANNVTDWNNLRIHAGGKTPKKRYFPWAVEIWSLLPVITKNTFMVFHAQNYLLNTYRCHIWATPQ